MKRVVLSQIFYPMSLGRYFENALQRRDDVELITIGPYTENWIPWNGETLERPAVQGGMYVDEKYARPPTHPYTTQSMLQTLPIQWALSKITEDVDLWIEVDAAFNFGARSNARKHVVIATDAHCINYDKQRAYSDLLVNLHPKFSKPGDLKLSYAYDPTIHKPVETTVDRDIAFCGVLYDERRALLGYLEANGISVKTNNGFIMDEATEFQQQGRIGFNLSSAGDFNARAFELAAMGLPVLMDRCDDSILPLIEIERNDYREWLWQANNLLSYRALRQDYAEQVRGAVQPYTYDYLIERIFDAVL